MRGAVAGWALMALALWGCGDDSTAGARDAGGDATAPPIDLGGDIAELPPPLPSRCRTAADCPAPPTGAAPCVVSVCDVATARCLLVAADGDGDGVGPSDCPVPAGPDSVQGTDCDDTNPLRFPGRMETCDPGDDEDCDTTTTGTRDLDGDGFGSGACCNVDDVLGETVCGPDCDDADAEINPDADDGPMRGCDGRDNDCDGAVDVGCLCGADVPCGGAPDGIHNESPALCRRGVQRCTMGVLGMCEAAVGPQVESCAADGVDEDCDGVVNEPEACGCTDGMERACGLPDGAIVGGASTCVAGRQVCVGGAWDACSGTIPPATETCDAAARDEDCDGTANEGCACSGTEERACGVEGLMTGGSSQCRAGTQRCEGGVFSTCVGSVGPSSEVCDTLDNDCDGMLNEDPESSATCAASNAVTRCDLGRCVVVSCAPGFDDCDGDARNGCETMPATSAAHCGMCNRGCDAGEPCVAGVCDPVVEVAVGYDHSCARKSSGRVWCWGDNSAGLLGAGTTDLVHSTAVPIPGLSDATQLALGLRHTCAIRTGGTMSCWGNNTFGQAGVMPPTSTARPNVVAGLPSVSQATAADGHTCAVTPSGSAYCWGQNESGEHGNGTYADDTMPIWTPALVLLAEVVEIRAAAFSTHFRTLTGEVHASGDVYPPIAMRANPTLVATGFVGGRRAVEIAAGPLHVCALSDAGTVHCWGFSGSYLGWTPSGGEMYGYPGRQVMGILDAIELDVGGYGRSCVRLISGAVRCWGILFDGTDSPIPRELSGLPTARQIAMGDNHACAIVGAEEVVCVGQNDRGQLGDGTMSTRSMPVRVLGLE